MMRTLNSLGRVWPTHDHRLGMFCSPNFYVLVPVQKFINGREQQAELYEEGANILSGIRTKVSLHTRKEPIVIITDRNTRSKRSTKTQKK